MFRHSRDYQQNISVWTNKSFLIDCRNSNAEMKTNSIKFIGRAITGNFSVRQITPKVLDVIYDSSHGSICPLSKLSLKSYRNFYCKSQIQLSSVHIIPEILAVVYATNHRPSSPLAIVICSLSRINSTAATLQ